MSPWKTLFEVSQCFLLVWPHESLVLYREMLVPQVDELVVFNRPMPLNQLSVAGVSREPGSTLERQRLALENQLTANGLAEQSWQLSNGLAEQRWRAGSSQCLANLNSWPSRLSLVE